MFEELNELIKSDELSQAKFESFKSSFAEEKEQLAKSALKRARATALVLAGSTILSLFFLLYAFIAKTNAEADQALYESKIDQLEQRLNNTQEESQFKPNNALPDPLKAGWNDEPVCEVLQENERIRVLKCTFPAGVGHEKHYHKPYVTYTIAGSKFRMTDAKGSREVNVPTGSSFYNKGIEWHEVLNIGDSTAVFLIIESKR